MLAVMTGRMHCRHRRCCAATPVRVTWHLVRQARRKADKERARPAPCHQRAPGAQEAAACCCQAARHLPCHATLLRLHDGFDDIKRHRHQHCVVAASIQHTHSSAAAGRPHQHRWQWKGSTACATLLHCHACTAAMPRDHPHLLQRLRGRQQPDRTQRAPHAALHCCDARLSRPPPPAARLQTRQRQHMHVQRVGFNDAAPAAGTAGKQRLPVLLLKLPQRLFCGRHSLMS